MSKTSIALGMFDGVHLGHIEVIKSALSCCDCEPAVFTFRLLRKINANIMPYTMKFSLLKQAGIKRVYSSDFDSVRNLSAEEFVKEILVEKMDCGRVSCGWNFRFAKNASADAGILKEICAKYGIQVNITSPVQVDGVPVSSTRIRKSVQNGDVVLANKMLGRTLSYELEVLEGEKLGRKLGFPTINQIIPKDCVLPKFGVYKSVVTVDSGEKERYTAVSNVGIKPTVNGTKPIMETHILDFNMDVYGQTLTTGLVDFVREERRFESLEELSAQISVDMEACRG